MTRSRRSMRYRVEDGFPVKACFRTGPVYDLRTLSSFGCGLYISAKDAKLAQQQEIELVLRMGHKSVPLRAFVRYCRYLPHKTGGVNYLGLEFKDPDPKQRTLMQLILDLGISKGHLSAA